MDIRIFDSRELPLVLGALRGVALANDRLTDTEAQLLDGLAALHGSSLREGDVPNTSAAELSRAVSDPHKRKRIVQLAIVTSLVEGRPGEASVEAVRELSQALEVPEEGLRVLDRVAHERAMLARLDMVRRVQRFATHNDGPSFLRVAIPTLLGLGQNPKLAARYQALADLPVGTLGRGLYDHYRSHDFALPGEKGGLPELMLFHDVGHVVSGYGVKPQDEIQQAAFQAGFARTDGFVFLLFGILQFHLGLRITPVAKGEQGLFDVPKVMAALARGAACRMDFSDRFDFFAHAPESLEVLRKRWEIPSV
ncbi:MAG: hypothetical protein K0R38_3478 [Polyangiaceae bacterium]|jgi:hypothetical protein|nr:hypothetical protein [Polyangiaceae bacterium]